MKGPRPTRGFDIALPIAQIRGRVMIFRPLPDHVCDFTITGNGIFALVRLMTTTRLRASIEDICWEFSGTIAGLCTIPSGGPVSRELWLYSRYRTLRFFRVTESGLEEIDCCGFLFVNGKPVMNLPVFPGTMSRKPGPASPGPVDPGDPLDPVMHYSGKKIAGKKPEPHKNNPNSPANRMMSHGASEKPAAGKYPSRVPDTAIHGKEIILVRKPAASCEESPVLDGDICPLPGEPGKEY